MIKIIFANAAIGGAVLLTGVAIYEMTDFYMFGDRMAGIGFIYAALSLSALVIPLYKNVLIPNIQKLREKRIKSEAYDDLLRYKMLLDKEIISKEEFDTKSRELKSKVL